MNVLKYLIIFGLQNVIFAADSDVTCLICKVIAVDIDNRIHNVGKRRRIDVGGFRLGPDGNQKTVTRPYARSEIFLTEVLEEVCNIMEDHVQALNKDTGKRAVIPLVKKGYMNTELDSYQIEHVEKNIGLKKQCEYFLGEYDEDFVNFFASELDDVPTKICTDVIKVCKSSKLMLPNMEL